MRYLLFASLAFLVFAFVHAAADETSACSDLASVTVQTCLDQVERDEAALPGGPCSSSDWKCICTKQQGMVDCYVPCPDQMPSDAKDFDKNNCAGQHDGISINSLGGDLLYTWSNLNVAKPGSGGVAPTSSAPPPPPPTNNSSNNGGGGKGHTTTYSPTPSPSAASSAPTFTGVPGNNSTTSSAPSSAALVAMHVDPLRLAGTLVLTLLLSLLLCASSFVIV